MRCGRFVSSTRTSAPSPRATLGARRGAASRRTSEAAQRVGSMTPWEQSVTAGKYEAAHPDLSERRILLGRWLFRLATLLLVVVAIVQALDSAGVLTIGLPNWRPLLYTYIVWGVALGGSQILTRGEAGQRA